MSLIIRQLHNKEDIERIQRFRYQQYANRGRHSLPGMQHEVLRHNDGLDDKSWIIEAYDEKTGRTVGTARTTPLASSMLSLSLEQHLSIFKLLRLVDRNKISYSSALMVDLQYRKRGIAISMAKALYQLAYDADIHLDICMSSIAGSGLLLSFGYRPYLNPARLSNSLGLRLPLLIPVKDRLFLQSVESPFRHQCTAAFPSLISILKAHFPNLNYHPFADQYVEQLIHTDAFSIFNKADLKECLAPFLVYRFEPGDCLVDLDEPNDDAYYIIEGRLDLKASCHPYAHTFTTLTDGDGLCLECRNQHQTSTYRAVVTTNSKIIFFTPKMVEKLCIAKPKLANQLLLAFNRLIAKRQAVYEKKLIDQSNHLKYNPSTVNQRSDTRPARNERDWSITAITGHPGIDQDIEINRLISYGLNNHMNVLTAGIDPGATSILLSKHFPHAQVIGLDPDPVNRQENELAIIRKHFQHQIKFLDGTIDNIPLPDNSIDFVYARFAFQAVTDPLQSMKELRRVTKSSGRVVFLDIDTQGVIINPEPKGFQDFQKRSSLAQLASGHDRFIGRKLINYMTQLDFKYPTAEELPVTSRLLPVDVLIEIVFGFKEQLLKQSGLWQSEDIQLINKLKSVPSSPGHWIYLPLIYAHGQPQKHYNSIDERNG